MGMSLTHLLADSTIECGAGKCCTLFNIPMEDFPDTGKPRHMCMHCRKGIHTMLFTMGRWDWKASRGYSLCLSSIHKDDQMEATSFNNDGCILCFKCCEALNAVNNIMWVTYLYIFAMTFVLQINTYLCHFSFSNIDLTDDEVSQLGSSTLSTPKAEEGIWSDKYVTKVAWKNGKQGWQCGWCNKVFSTLHATRVVCHFLKLKGSNIATCQAIIPEEHQEHYQKIREKSVGNSRIHAKVKDDIDEFIDGRQELATDLFMTAHGISLNKSPNTPTITSFLKSTLAKRWKKEKIIYKHSNYHGHCPGEFNTIWYKTLQQFLPHNGNCWLH